MQSSLISMLLEPLWGCIVGNEEIQIQRRFHTHKHSTDLNVRYAKFLYATLLPPLTPFF